MDSLLLIFLNYPHIIVYAVWIALAVSAFLSYRKISGFKKLSWKHYVLLAVGTHLLYGALLSLGQYYVWNATEATRIFLTAPVPPETPLVGVLEWLRPLFEREGGYFLFYSFNHFFFSQVLAIMIATILSLPMLLFAKLRLLSITSEDAQVLLFALLVAGWPRVILFIPVTVLVALCLYGLRNYFSGKNALNFQMIFLIALFIVLILDSPFGNASNLYTLLGL